MNRPIRLAILGSGNGTNAQRISEYFAESKEIEVACIIYNRRDAYIAERAKNLGIEARYFNKHDFNETEEVLNYLKEKKIDYVILAGFLLMIPQNLLDYFTNRIINIHPALLPKYGGKGMYGEHVHEAVIANHEKESGITIHIIDQQYDRGTTLFQAHCEVTPDDTPDTLAQKIHQLEQTYFPVVIEKTVLQK
ncbi:MAG: phosphoribosylglycinamide formyltransferase [Bacteroidales bacterium]|nr:phosphoribosylglycinamide formyltransferase [Bacteroidales bacterium]